MRDVDARAARGAGFVGLALDLGGAFLLAAEAFFADLVGGAGDLVARKGRIAKVVGAREAFRTRAAWAARFTLGEAVVLFLFRPQEIALFAGTALALGAFARGGADLFFFPRDAEEVIFARVFVALFSGQAAIVAGDTRS